MPLATLVIRIDREIKRLAEDQADEKGLTVSAWIKELIIAQDKREKE
jgi:antitoxin component of RelBE/YafQ-DinJ toxin-antitoxin module